LKIAFAYDKSRFTSPWFALTDGAGQVRAEYTGRDSGNVAASVSSFNRPVRFGVARGRAGSS
jgi:hypothetical protein